MKTLTMPEKKVHEGRNIKRIREILGIKQEALAIELDMTQQNVSMLEQRETIDGALLERVAEILKVPVEAIRNFDEESTISFIATTFNNSALFNNNCQLTFNPIEKMIELYERMLKEKDELIAKLMEERKK